MMRSCGCPDTYPDWHDQDIDLSLHAVHALPIPTFLHMPLSYELYRQRQQQEVAQFELRETWPGFTLTRTGMFHGRLLRLLENQTSPSRHFTRLDANFRLHGFLHHGGIGTIRHSVRQQQMQLLDRGSMPKEIYLSYLTCPVCAAARGGDKILLLRRWKTHKALTRKLRR